jgi:hypothetical protein
MSGARKAAVWQVGGLAKDTATGRVGVVVDRAAGPVVRLRPLAGGRTWDADPAELEEPSRQDVLSEKVGASNQRTQREAEVREGTAAHLAGEEPRRGSAAAARRALRSAGYEVSPGVYVVPHRMP